MKKKDLIRLDEEATLKLQAEFDEEERLAREKAEKEKEANIALIETWDDFASRCPDGPPDTQYRMEDHEQAFVEYVSSRTDEVGVLKAIPDRIAGTLPRNTVKNPKLSTFLVLSARSYLTEDPQCSTHVHSSINAITICPKQPNEPQNDEPEEKERGREGNPEDTNTMAHNEEQRDTPQLELKDTTTIDNLGPNRNDDGVEWLDVKEPLDLVDTRLGRDMCVFVGNMSYVMDFIILESIENNIDPSLSNMVFGRPFVEIACLDINRKYGLITFTDGIKEITFKTPYKDPERSELSSEGHDLLSSRLILSDDDYDRGCRKPSHSEDRFYRDTIKLGPEYATRMDDEGEVTKAHLLEDKQISSVEIFSTWVAFGRNTPDLGPFVEETGKITDLHQIHEEVLFTERGDGVTGIKTTRDLPVNGVRDLRRT
ncbi:hypothetical protein Tco_0339659 [Tanacetum coccineum]